MDNRKMRSGGRRRSTLLNGLVAYWKMDETSDGYGAVTRNDSVGTSHLTDNGTTPSTAGLVGNGALFTAANQEYLSVVSNAALQMGDIDFTITAWVKLANVTNVHDLITKYNNYATNQREYSILYFYVDPGNVENRFVFSVSPNGSFPISRVFATTMGEPLPNRMYFIRAWHNSVSNKLCIQVDNGSVDSVDYSGGVFVGTSPFIVGGLPAAARWASAVVDEVGLWKRLLTDAEAAALYNGGSGNSYPFDGTAPRLNNLVVFDGNSMTDGSYSSYPASTVALLGSGWDVFNFGVSGQTTIEMIADGAAQIDAHYVSSRSVNVVVCWEGTNDLKLGATRADAQARLVEYCQSRQAAGWKVVVVTILPRTQTGLPATFEDDRTAINEYIRANYASFADAVADVAADGRIGDFGDSTDTTYFTDGVHMTSAGYGIVAEIVAAAIGTL